jgi:hypothetical protein
MKYGEPRQDSERMVRDDADGSVNATFELVAGTAAVVVAGFAAVALFPAPGAAGRLVVLAVAVGLVAAVCTDWRAAAGVAAVAALVFVGFLTHRYGVLTGDPTPWSFTPLLGFATVLGRGYRRLTHAVPKPQPQGSEKLSASPRTADVTSLLVWSDRQPASSGRRMPENG